MKSTDAGHLKCAMRSRHYSISPASVGALPSRRTTTALIASPHF